MSRLPYALLILSLVACGGGDDEPGTVALFDLNGDVASTSRFFAFPFPSDLRLRADGTPDLTGYPNPKQLPLLDALLLIAEDRPAFSAMPTAFISFDGPIAPHTEQDPIPASADSPVLLVDVDPDSPERGRLFPTVARSLVIDDYAPNPTLAIAAFPGVILRGDRTYAFVVMRSLGDEAGDPLGVPPALRALARDEVPDGAWGADAAALYAPMFETLDQIGVDRDRVAAATVFTTGDIVADTFALSEAVREAHDVTIDDLALDPTDGTDHDRYCELLATVDYPQFQRGTPPFDDDGRFEIGADGAPVVQRTETATVVVTIPRTEMPAEGYPLMLYFHGSGGVPSQIVNRGPVLTPGGSNVVGQGPGYVVAEHGIAAAGSALPLSPDRLPGASAIEYLNFNNLSAFRDTFRQGILEQRLLLDALLALEIDPATLTGCDGPTLPAGATAFTFDPGAVVASGQSMGGMYTNLIGPVDPRIRAAVPTGAGGFWHFFILETSLVPGAGDLMSAILGTPFDELTYLHPGMALVSLAWEGAEPFVYMPRLGARPLPGHPVRPIYEPVGLDDIYFPPPVFDAAAIAYGNQQAGEEVWPTMQQALSIVGRDGMASYPVTGNRTADDGTAYTGVVVQYADDGIENAHYIFAQLDEVKYQYGCFFATFLARGAATVPAPAELGTPCP